MIDQGSLWDDWHGAEAYREYVEEYPLYPALNARLAELADLSSARSVLDLGCGTGTTTAACLEHLTGEGRIVAVDSAATMVEIARSRIRDRRVRFLRLHSSDLSVGLECPFDRVVSNAALWLFPRPCLVLREIGRLTAPGGLLVFNVPAHRLAGQTGTPHPFQLELANELRAQTFGRPRPPLPLFEPNRIRVAIEKAAFAVDAIERYVHTGRQRELVTLMEIPAMIERLAPDFDRDQGLEMVRRAAERCDPDLEIEVPWIYWIARRLTGEAPPG